jgi:hypothetical protein
MAAGSLMEIDDARRMVLAEVRPMPGEPLALDIEAAIEPLRPWVALP